MHFMPSKLGKHVVIVKLIRQHVYMYCLLRTMWPVGKTNVSVDFL